MAARHLKVQILNEVIRHVYEAVYSPIVRRSPKLVDPFGTADKTRTATLQGKVGWIDTRDECRSWNF